MKIHIIGASGSGKSCLAKKLAEKYGIRAYSLDDIFWDNNGFGKKRSEDERAEMLGRILDNDDWIIEGVQYAWLAPSFERADVIYYLDTPKIVCRYRIVRRFILRKLKGTCRKNENVSSLVALIRWTGKFYRVNAVEIFEILKKYADKTVYLKKKSEVLRLYE